jgi:hypothetical protein
VLREIGYNSKTRNGTDNTHMHTCFSLAQGCRSGWRLCRKIGSGDKPHSNIIFKVSEKVFTVGKNMGHDFLGNPHIY